MIRPMPAGRCEPSRRTSRNGSLMRVWMTRTDKKEME